MTPTTPHRKHGYASVAALGVSFLLSLDACPAASGSPPGGPDLELVSVATSHTELAPRTNVMLTFGVRAKGASVGNFSVGAYYDRGPVAAAGRVPRTAELLDTYAVQKGVKKGETVTFQMPVQIPPCDVCGIHTIYVLADSGQALLEVTRTNNVRAVTLDVARDYLPDLRVSAVSLDRDRGSIADKVEVRGTIRNDSRYYAEGPFRVSVYCSPDAALTHRDRRLYSFVVPTLAAGQTVGIDRSVQLVPECGVEAATTWLGVVADDQDSVAESNEDDNTKPAPYWVFHAPDLTSRHVYFSTAEGPAGTRLDVSFRIANQGEAAAGAFRTGVYLAQPGQPLTQGKLLDVASIPSLAANTDSGAIQHLVTIPNVPRGRYSLGVLVDIDGRNGELQRWNNGLTEPFEVTEINLTDVHFTAQRKEVTPGNKLELKLAVRDTGNSPAPASKVGIYYSDDPRFDRGEDVRVGGVDIERLLPGAATKDKAVTVTVPKNAREGYRFLLAVIDDAQAVAETDERDNIALEPILVLPTDRIATASQ